MEPKFLLQPPPNCSYVVCLVRQKESHPIGVLYTHMLHHKDQLSVSQPILGVPALQQEVYEVSCFYWFWLQFLHYNFAPLPFLCLFCCCCSHLNQAFSGLRNLHLEEVYLQQNMPNGGNNAAIDGAAVTAAAGVTAVEDAAGTGAVVTDGGAIVTAVEDAASNGAIVTGCGAVVTAVEDAVSNGAVVNVCSAVVTDVAAAVTGAVPLPPPLPMLPLPCTDVSEP
jgi:hypothetical protein